MMIVKGILLLSLLGVCSYMGIAMAGKFRLRLNQLQDFKKALTLLQTKMKYTYQPIPEIFAQIGQTMPEPVGNIFLVSSQQMENLTAQQAWEQTVQNARTNLKKEDKQVLLEFGKQLGKTDIEGQESQIALTLTFLENRIEEAKKELEKNAKLYQTLGVVSGLALVIILL